MALAENRTAAGAISDRVRARRPIIDDRPSRQRAPVQGGQAGCHRRGQPCSRLPCRCPVQVCRLLGGDLGHLHRRRGATSPFFHENELLEPPFACFNFA
jgi:hypothetical protein